MNKNLCLIYQKYHKLFVEFLQKNFGLIKGWILNFDTITGTTAEVLKSKLRRPERDDQVGTLTNPSLVG